jgi:hypothetical protein
MIYIKETFPDAHSVAIWVDGILDTESIPVLKTVCERHLEGKKRVLLHLEKLLLISREAKDFLRDIKNKVIISDSA